VPQKVSFERIRSGTREEEIHEIPEFPEIHKIHEFLLHIKLIVQCST
jgi:hypothetical protein